MCHLLIAAAETTFKNAYSNKYQRTKNSPSNLRSGLHHFYVQTDLGHTIYIGTAGLYRNAEQHSVYDVEARRGKYLFYLKIRVFYASIQLKLV